jgi:PAS domain S-box-containing protein
LVEQALRGIREQGTRNLLVIAALLLVPAIAASVFRGLAIGWHWVQFVHIVLAMVVWTATLLRAQLGHPVLAAVIVVSLAIAGAIGVMNFGLLAGAMPIFLTLPVIAQVLYSTRVGAFILVLVLLHTGLAGYLSQIDRLPLAIDPANYFFQPEAWVIYIATAALVVGTTLAGLHVIVHGLRDEWRSLRADLQGSRKELGRVQQLLEEERAAHARTALRLSRRMNDVGVGHWEYAAREGTIWLSPGARMILRLAVDQESFALEEIALSLGNDVAPQLQSELARAIEGDARLDIGCWLPAGAADKHCFLRFIGCRYADDAAGQVIVSGTLHDESERERERLVLDAERRRLLDVIDANQLGIWDWNVQSGETVFNERWAEIAGYTLEDLSPTSIDTWMQLGHPEDLKESSRLLELHFQGETDSYRCEARIRHRDGHWVWVEDRGRVVEWDAAGKPLRMVGSHLDITHQRLLEQQLENQRFMLEEVGRIARVGGWIYSEADKYLYWSEQTRLMHEVPDDFEPDLTTAITFYHEDDRDLIERAVREGMAHGRPWDLTLRIVTYRGNEHWVRTLGEVTSREPGSVVMLGTFQWTDPPSPVAKTTGN